MLANKGVVNAYAHPRVYRPQDEDPLNEKKIVITRYGMLDTQGLSNIPEVVEVRGTRKKNAKTVGKHILKSEYKVVMHWNQARSSKCTKRERR